VGKRRGRGKREEGRGKREEGRGKREVGKINMLMNDDRRVNDNQRIEIFQSQSQSQPLTPHPFPSSSSHLTNLPSKPSPPPPPQNIIASTTAALTSPNKRRKKNPQHSAAPIQSITVVANLSLPHSFHIFTFPPKKTPQRMKEIPISDLLNLAPA